MDKSCFSLIFTPSTPTPALNKTTDQAIDSGDYTEMPAKSLNRGCRSPAGLRFMDVRSLKKYLDLNYILTLFATGLHGINLREKLV